MGLCLSLGCAGGEVRSWEGETVTLLSEDGIAPCGGTVQELDRVARDLHDYWGAPLESEPRQYEIVLRKSGLVAGEEDSFAGLAVSSELAWVRSQYPLRHELVHLVTGSSDGTSIPSLLEGVAVALGGSQWVHGGRAHPEEFVFQPWSAEHYALYGQLWAYMTRTYGREAIKQAYRESNWDDEPEELEDAWLGVFGDGLYDAFDDFAALDGVHCPLSVLDCGGGLEAVALPIDVRSVDDCTAESDIVGFVGGEGYWPMRRFVFDLEEASLLEVTIRPNTDLVLWPCLECVTVRDTELFERSPVPSWPHTGTYEFPAGRYVAEVIPEDLRSRGFGGVTIAKARP